MIAALQPSNSLQLQVLRVWLHLHPAAPSPAVPNNIRLVPVVSVNLKHENPLVLLQRIYQPAQSLLNATRNRRTCCCSTYLPEADLLLVQVLHLWSICSHIPRHVSSSQLLDDQPVQKHALRDLLLLHSRQLPTLSWPTSLTHPPSPSGSKFAMIVSSAFSRSLPCTMAADLFRLSSPPVDPRRLNAIRRQAPPCQFLPRCVHQMQAPTN